MRRTGLLLCVALSACGEDDKTPSLSELDAGLDAGADAGKEDAGPLAEPDGGITADAGEPDASEPNEADAGFTPPSGVRCGPNERVGGFVVHMFDGYTSADGRVRDGVVSSASLTEVAAEAGCKLIKKTNPFCDPLCSGGAVCTVDGTCVPEPLSVNLGTVRIAGLVQPVAMMPTEEGFRYFDVSLPEVGIVAGGEVTLTSELGEPEPLLLQAVGVAPLVVTTSEVVVEQDQPLVVSWQVPAAGAARVRLIVNVDQHGNSPVALTCETDDDGEHTVPSSLINQLRAAGISGFPNAHIYRESVDSRMADGHCVDFVVSSQVQLPVNVADHTPCNGDGDCPDGQTCQLAINTCQ